MDRSRILVPMVITAVLAAPLSAQQVERLARPIATFPEPFSTVSGLRELSDGRLLVSDRLEQSVRFVNPRTGSMEEIGRAGGGPGEYQMPAGLIPLPGDSTVLVDFGNMRLSLIAPDGRIVRSSNLMRGENVFAQPAAADGEGGLYFDHGGVRVSADGGIEADPRAAIVRFGLDSDRMDTVALLPLPASAGRTQTVSMRGGEGNFSIMGGLSPYGARDVWTVAPDGRIAIVHANPYHVEWIAPDGRAVSGPSVVYDPVRITDRDKEAWASRMSQGALMVAVDGGGGGGRGEGGGRTMRMPRPDIDQQEWPEFKPPFGRGAATATPEGTLWVQRHVAFGAPQSFDVFDGRGRRIKQVVLPEGRRLVGFGPGKVYAVNVDEDDLQWLEVYTR